MSTLEEQLGGSRNVIGGPFGSKLTQKDYAEEGVPVIRGSNMVAAGRWLNGEFAFVSAAKVDADLKGNLAQPGDIIVTQRGTLGQVAIVPDRHGFERYVISQSQMAVRVPDHKANRDFVFYFLQSPRFAAYVETSTIQTGVPHINLGILRSAPAIWPEREQQAQIASVLAALDDKIDLNRRMNETLEALSRAIFKDWFVDFGPTRAKAQGRTPYLAPELWNLFPDALDDEDKPVGWEVRKLEDFLELAYGKSLPAKKRMTGNVAVYGSGGLAGTHDTAMIEGPAVIVGRKGTVGSLYWEDGPAFPIDTVFYVVPRIGSILFSYQLLASQPLRDMNTDAAVPGLNRGNAYRLGFPLPALELISAFEDVAGALWKRRAKSLKETKTITQTRDLLLPKLMSGEIRLTEAEEAVETMT